MILVTCFRPQVAMRAARADRLAVQAVSAPAKTVVIGTRGSPLALAQAYLTRDLLKVNLAKQPVTSAAN